MFFCLVSAARRCYVLVRRPPPYWTAVVNDKLIFISKSLLFAHEATTNEKWEKSAFSRYTKPKMSATKNSKFASCNRKREELFLNRRTVHTIVVGKPFSILRISLSFTIFHFFLLQIHFVSSAWTLKCNWDIVRWPQRPSNRAYTDAFASASQCHSMWLFWRLDCFLFSMLFCRCCRHCHSFYLVLFHEQIVINDNENNSKCNLLSIITGKMAGIKNRKLFDCNSCHFVWMKMRNPLIPVHVEYQIRLNWHRHNANCQKKLSHNRSVNAMNKRMKGGKIALNETPNSIVWIAKRIKTNATFYLFSMLAFHLSIF